MKKLTLIAAAALMALPATTAAQATTGTINATATVQQSLVVNGNRPLAFGNIFPGAAARNIALTDATNSGRFVVTGAASAEVNVGLSFGAMINGANTLTPTYSARYNVSGTDDQSGTNFTNPGTVTETVNLSGAGNMYVYVGGSLSAPGGQATGNYTAVVTLSVQYTGN